MLIVNADDLGRSPEETDAALACYVSGRVTSTTAMVFMRDSARAADRANDAGIDVGLHLNLSEPFTASVDRHIQRAHDRVVRFLTAHKYAVLVYHPLIRQEFKTVVHAQIDEFVRLYGRAPSHVDGHQHQHLCANVLVDKLIPEPNCVRRSFSFWPGEKSAVNRLYRSGVDRVLARRYRLADYFFSLEQGLRHDRLARIFSLAVRSTVEVMTHPVKRAEYDYLMSERFPAALTEVRLGSYVGMFQ